LEGGHYITKIDTKNVTLNAPTLVILIVLFIYENTAFLPK